MIAKLRSILSSFSQPSSDGLHSYKNTFVTLQQMGRERERAFRVYQKTYDFDAPFINATQERFRRDTAPGALIDLGIEGWLLADDALKLYEMAYYTKGNVLELGTYMGLSASIMAQALADAGAAGKIETVELDDWRSDLAKAEFESRDPALLPYVKFIAQDAAAFMDDALDKKKTYSFSFVDHSHRTADVKAACERLPQLIEPGGFVLFHDFNDARNAQNHPDYGVFQGVRDGLSRKHFAFWGCFGCTALYRRSKTASI